MMREESGAILENEFPAPGMAERKVFKRNIALLYLSIIYFFIPISGRSIKFYSIRYFSFSFEKKYSYKSSLTYTSSLDTTLP